MTEFMAQPDDTGDLQASDLHSSIGERLGAQAGEAFMGGVRTAGRLLQYSVAEGTAPLTGDSAAMDPELGQQLQRDRDAIPSLPMADAQARVKQEGLEHHLKLPDQPTIKQPVLDLVVQHAHERADYEAAVARGPQGFIPGALGFVTEIGAGIIDPINIAAFSIPVIGEARFGMMLAGAGDSMLARAGVRAVAGAAQGAVGSTALLPGEWWLKSQDGQDFTMADALHSVVMGAGMGAAFHAGHGGVSDFADRRAGRPLKGSPEDLVSRGLARAKPLAEPAQESVPAPGEEVPGVAAASPEAAESQRDGIVLPSKVDVNGEEFHAAPHPAEILADLPPGVREDVARSAIADIINDRPVRAGELLDIASQQDSRIAETVGALDNVPDSRPAIDEALSRDERQDIHDDAKQQLVAAGMAPEEAEHNAAVVAARYVTRADRLGGKTSALELYRNEGIEIRQGADADVDGRSFDQARRRELEGQQDLPGFGPISDAEKAQRAADQGLKAKVNQKPMDVGLFGDDAAQSDLVDRARGGRSFDQSHPTAPTFYSAVSRTIDAAKQEKASPEQWLGTLRNAAGVKAEELQWLGLDPWLKAQKGSVTKQQIADYVRANQIEVKDVEKTMAPVQPAEMRAASEELMGMPFDELSEAGKDTLHDRLSEGRQPKFERWTLPGGTHYRELLLTLPSKTEPRPNGFSTTEGARDYNERDRSNFRNSHFDEPNILAHVRFNDRMIDGKKALFIEEVQSDWHQTGKRKGYAAADAINSARVARELADSLRPAVGDMLRRNDYLGFESLGEAQQAIGRDNPENWEFETPDDLALARRYHAARQSERESRQQTSAAVPDAPFKTTWPELAMKRMIRYAAEKGYDKIAWTPGDVQAARYDLSKQVDSVYYDPTKSRFVAVKDGHVVTERSGVRPDDLEGLVGKEVAKKLLETEPRTSAIYDRHDQASDATPVHILSEQELSVGGEGMSGFYDKMLPATVNKLVKKFGSRVEVDKLDGSEGQPLHVYEAEDRHGRTLYEVRNSNTGDVIDSFATRGEADKLVAKEGEKWEIVDVTDDGRNQVLDTYPSQEAAEEAGRNIHDDSGIEIRKAGPEGSPVHAIDITPALRKAAVEDGMPLFQKDSEGTPRGRITLNDNKAVVELFAKADKSTFMHEAGHLWLDELVRDAAKAGDGTPLKTDLGKVLTWLGVEKPEDIGTEQHEQWARGFEQYLADGKAPSSALAQTFEKFKQWIAEIYRSLTDLGAPISADIRGVMDRMLASDEEIADRRAFTKATKPKKGPASRDPRTFSLFEFLASRGGVKPEQQAAHSGTLQSILDRNPFVPGFGRLLRKDGMTLDRAREAANEAGYIFDQGDHEGRVKTTDIRELLDLMAEENRGNRQYRMGEERAKKADRSQELHEIEREFDGQMLDEGMDLASLDPRLKNRAIEIMDKEGEQDAGHAYERAVMEDGERYEGTVRGRQTDEETQALEGWDVDHDAGATSSSGGETSPGGSQGGRANQSARGRLGEATRAGSRDAGTPADQAEAWRKLNDRGDPEADADAAASRAADREPEPASVDPEKAPSAAEKAASEADQLRKDIEASLSPEEKARFDQVMQDLENDKTVREQLVREGAACLLEALG